MKTRTKIIIIVAAVALAFCAIWRQSYLSTENKRLQSNVETLRDGMTQYVVKDSLSAASIARLQLKNAELDEYSQTLADAVTSMGIKLKRVESAAQSQTQTQIIVEVPLRDTVFLHDTIVERAKSFAWRDAWCSVDGIVANDSVACKVTSTDTLIQVVHRVPKKFLFFKCGTKEIRQEIMSTNPHTKIVYTEFIQLD
jgi:hypothetical protein